MRALIVGTPSRNAVRGNIGTAAGIGRLTAPPKVVNAPMGNFGAFQPTPGFSPTVGNAPKSITFNMVNGGATTLTYTIGDPQGIVAAAYGLTVTAITTTDGPSVASVQASFIAGPVTVRGILYSVTSGATQFGQSFTYRQADVDNSSSAQPIQWTSAQRPTNFNANQLIYDMSQSPYRLDWNSAFVVLVAAGQTASVTLMIDAAANR